MIILTSLLNVLLLFCFLFSGCSSFKVKDEVGEKNIASDSGKILIVYLSRTKNTTVIAEIIHQYTSSKLIALQLEKPYPENYQASVQQVSRLNETGYLPPLRTRVDSIQYYDVVFVGFPTWGMKLPPPVKSFLKGYD